MSYGSPSPNSLIDKSKIKISMDSLILFAPFLIEKKKTMKDLVLWKSNVDNTYCMLPMCFQWQFRKAVCIKKKFRIDRCCNFGSSGSPKIWCSFWSLVLWIAEFVLGIKGMNNLMDDTWGVCFLSEMIILKQHRIPVDQAKLLTLFDFIGVPWNWKKQVSGIRLEIIGHVVDTVEMSFYLRPLKKAELVHALRTFTQTVQPCLIDWQHLTGWGLLGP